MKYLVIIVIIFCLLSQIFSLRHLLQNNGDQRKSREGRGNSNNIIYAENDNEDDELDAGNIISLFKSMVDVLRKKHIIGVDDDFNSFTKKGLSLPKFKDDSNTNLNNIGEARFRAIVTFQQVPIAYVPVFHSKVNGFEHAESQTEYISPMDQQLGKINSYGKAGRRLAYLIRANNRTHFNDDVIANGEGFYTASSDVMPNLAPSFRVDDNNNFVRDTQQQSPNEINQGDDTPTTDDNGIKINEFDDQWELEKYPEQNDDDNMPREPIPPPNNKDRYYGTYNTGQMFGRRSMAYDDTNYNTANMRNVYP